jgi:hypothetical protein
MVPLLFVLAFFCILIAFGVCVSVYLYEGGAVGKRRRVRATLVAESTAEDYGEDESYSYMGPGPTASTTSRLARSSLLAILMGLVVIVMLITSFVSTVLH